MLEFSDTPLVYALLVVNILASIYAFIDNRFLAQSVFHVGAIRAGKQYHRIITSAFLHGSAMHLAFNMLTLLFMGPAVEYTIGTQNFFLVYTGSLLTSAGVSLLARRNDPDYSSLGASGAISGVVLSFCTFAPFKMLYFFSLIPIPAIVFAIGFIGYSAVAMKNNDRIAHEAHLGGALGGAIITFMLSPDIILQGIFG